MCRSFVESVVPAPISVVVKVSGARVPIVVVLSDARVPDVVVISGARVPNVVVISGARVPNGVVIPGARVPGVVVIPGVRIRAACGFSWLVLATGDGWNSKSGRSLDGIPVGVDGVYDVLAVGASRWREVMRCAGSHFSRNSMSPTCIASSRRSCWSSRARPSLLILNMSELAFSEANCTSLRHLDICSNFISHPLIMTSMSFDVIGVGGVVPSGWGSSSLKWTSSSPSPSS